MSLLKVCYVYLTWPWVWPYILGKESKYTCAATVKLTVGYLYPGIRAKGLMSATSAQTMVQNATATSSDSEDEVSASSDPQGPGHASSNSEYEVSASSDP